MKEAPVVGYYGLGNKYKENALTLQNCRKALKKFNCINDNLKHDGSIGMFSVLNKSNLKKMIEIISQEFFNTQISLAPIPIFYI